MSNKTLKEKNLHQFIIILTIAIIASILNILHVIIGAAKTPSGYQYLATGHYYLDYFYYLVPITQGMRGKWLFENYYANDEVFKTILGPWQYLIFGKIGGFFHLDPIKTYWLAVIVLSIILCFFIFKLINLLLEEEPDLIKYAAFIMTLFAGPFFKIDSTKIIPFDFWNDKATLFQRLGVIPHHFVSSICAIILILIFVDYLKKLSSISFKDTSLRLFAIILLIFFLLTFSPTQAILILVAFSISGLFFLSQLYLSGNKKTINLFVFLSLTLIIGLLLCFLVRSQYQALDFFVRLSKIEVLWQTYPSATNFILVSGPIVLFTPFGIKKFIKNLTPIKIVFTSYILIGIVFFYTPLAYYLGTTNSRFLNSLNYVLLAQLAILGIKNIANLTKSFAKKTLVFLFFVIVVSFTPSTVAAFNNMINDANIFSPITYLSDEMIEGFYFLNSFNDNKIVLTSPAQLIGSIIPIYTNKHVYIGRYFPTPNYFDKAALSDRFYLGQMLQPEASDFLYKNNIGYIFLSSIESYSPNNLTSYSNLKEIFKNKDVVIYQVK